MITPPPEHIEVDRMQVGMCLGMYLVVAVLINMNVQF